VPVRHKRSFSGHTGCNYRAATIQHATGTRAVFWLQTIRTACQSKKRTLVLDFDQYRYRAFISDISGQDIRAHGGDPERAIREVRDWLRLASKRATLPGGAEVIGHYRRFRGDLPALCAALTLEHDRLTFLDLSKTITDWLRMDR